MMVIGGNDVYGSYLWHVGDGDVSALSADANGEVSFIGRLVETGESCTSAGRLKLGGGQNPNY